MRVKNTIHGTLPCLIHAPQRHKWPIWKKLESHFEKTARQNDLRDLLEIDIITWNNLGKGIFEKSLESWGCKCKITGQNVVHWDNYKKFDYNIELCQQSRKNYIMGCDSHDVLVLADMDEILQKFKAMNVPMLFNCERYFYPDFDENIITQWRTNENRRGQGTKYPYLNSGAWIGEREAVLEFFKACQPRRVYDLFDCDNYPPLRKDFIGCDQSVVHHTLMDFPDVSLDYKCEIFMNIANMEESDVEFSISYL